MVLGLRSVAWLALLLGVLPLPAAAWQTVLTGSRALDSRDELEGVFFVPGGDLVLSGTADNAAILMRADASTGEPVWVRGGGRADTPAAVDGAGDFLTWTSREDIHDVSGQLVKVDGDTGTELWRWPTGPVSDVSDEITSIRVEPGGNLLAAGKRVDFTSSEETDFLVARIDGATGMELWRYSITGIPESGGLSESTDYAMAVRYSPNRRAVVAGNLERGGQEELVVVSLDLETGAERWRVTMPEPFGGSLRVDRAGDVLLSTNGVLRKVSGATGAELWHVDTVVNAMVVTPGGDVVIARADFDDSTLDSLYTEVQRLGPGGKRRWLRRLDDIALGRLAVTPRGDVVVGGTFAIPGGIDAGVLQLAGDTGVERWRHQLGLDPDTRVFHYRGQLNALNVTATGDVIAIGAIVDPVTSSDMFWARLSGETGAEIWRRTRSEPIGRSDHALRVVTGPHGEVVASGVLANPDTRGDFAVVGLSGRAGSERWRLEEDGGEPRLSEIASVVTLDGAGDVLAAGSIGKFGKTGGWDEAAAVVKANGLTGGVCWRGVVMSSVAGAFEDIVALLPDGSGDVLGVGGVTRQVGSVGGRPILEDAVMAFHFDGVTGVEGWRRRIGTGSAAAATLDAAGDLIVSANEGSGHRPLREPYLAKLSADQRHVLWQRPLAPQYAMRRGSFAKTAPMAIDTQGDVVTAGGWHDPAEDELVVTKVDATAGDVVWQRVFTGMTEPLALVADASGGVVILTAEAASVRILALGLDGEGVERWRHVFDDTDLTPADAALATAGDDLVVAGAVRTSDHGGDGFTAKLAGGSGELLWYRTVDGPGHGDDRISSVAVDAVGDVVLAGSLTGITSRSDFLVMKLRGHDGSDAPIGEDTPLLDTGNHCVPLQVEEPPVDPDPVDPDPVDPDPVDPEPPTDVPCLAADGADLCPDADVCNGIETCDLTTGRCRAGDPLVCDDGDACTVDDVCDPASGCVHRPLAAIPMMQCRADGRLPIPSCAATLPRRARRTLVRLQRVVGRLDASAPQQAKTFERIDRLCRRARRRLEQALAKRDAADCVAMQQTVLADVCPDPTPVPE